MLATLNSTLQGRDPLGLRYYQLHHAENVVSVQVQCPLLQGYLNNLALSILNLEDEQRVAYYPGQLTHRSRVRYPRYGLKNSDQGSMVEPHSHHGCILSIWSPCLVLSTNIVHYKFLSTLVFRRYLQSHGRSLVTLQIS